MQILLVAIVFCASVSAEVDLQNSARLSCSETSDNIVSVREILADNGRFSSKDGRYEVQYCRKAHGTVKWDLWMQTVPSLGPHNCSAPTKRRRRGPPPGQVHSIIKDEQLDINLNCSHVCISKYLDLMFRGCYYIHSDVKLEGNETYFYANNTIPGPEYFENSSHLVLKNDYDDEVIFHWHHERIPITEYDITMTKVTDVDGVHHSSQVEETDISANCSLSANVLSCAVRVPGGQYRVQLAHRAPWAGPGLFAAASYVHATLNHSSPVPLRVPPSVPAVSSLWGVVAGCCVLVVGGAVASAVWNTRVAGKVRRHVLYHWQMRARAAPPAEPCSPCPPCPACPACPAPRVLLLYAREGDLGLAAVCALKDLLELVAPGQVYDIHCPSLTARSAPSGPAWLRAALADRHTRLVLLMTPALCLAAPAAAPAPAHAHAPAPAHAPAHAHHEHNHLQVSLPLLPAAAVYRRPQYSDSLVQMALRGIADGAAGQPDVYARYYIATYSDLPTEVVPHVAAFRRYLLPAATSALLENLLGRPRPALAPAALLQRHERAVADFVTYVTHNDNYLAEEIMFP